MNFVCGAIIIMWDFCGTFVIVLSAGIGLLGLAVNSVAGREMVGLIIIVRGN